MKGFRINFLGDKATIDFEGASEGFWPTVQNTTVSVGQKKKEDVIYPDKGSDLQPGEKVSAIGRLESDIRLSAYDISVFTKKNDTDYNKHKLRKYQLSIGGLGDNGILKLAVQAESQTGEKITTTI